MITVARVAPSSADDAMLSVAPNNARLSRRPTTASRFAGLPAEAQALAFEFRPLVSPSTSYSLLATLVACTLIQLIVSAPYAVNERAVDTHPGIRTALRGLIVAIWAYFVIGAIFLVNAPMMVCGGFRRRYLLSLPITVSVSVSLAFVPVDGSTLGIISISLLTVVLAFAVCALLLNVPFFATDEHKALDVSFGVPSIIISVLFFGLIAAYVTLTKLYSSPLVGLLLPVGSAVTRVLALYALARSCHKFYHEPKQAFLTQLPLAQRQESAVPPLLGDIEAPYVRTMLAPCCLS